jgi:uncharacterized membrane protein (DUF485 family)
VEAALNETDRKRRIRRTTIVLALVALAVYIGFIALGVMRAG